MSGGTIATCVLTGTMGKLKGHYQLRGEDRYRAQYLSLRSVSTCTTRSFRSPGEYKRKVLVYADSKTLHNHQSRPIELYFLEQRMDRHLQHGGGGCVYVSLHLVYAEAIGLFQCNRAQIICVPWIMHRCVFRAGLRLPLVLHF